MEHTYDLLPRTPSDPNPLEDVKNKIGKIIPIAVYDEFEGRARVLQVQDARVFVEVVSVDRLFAPVSLISVGQRIWIKDWVV